MSAAGISLQPKGLHSHKALGDEDALKADVMTNIPLGAAGYMGVLNSADGIQEGGMVRNATYFNAEITKRFAGRKVKHITTAIYWQGVEEATLWIRKSLNGENVWSKTCCADEFGRIIDPDAEEVIYDETGASTVIDYESPIDIPCDYVLDGGPIYVGMDLQLRSEYSGIHAYVCSPAYTDGHWIFSPDPASGWEDFTGNGAYIFELTTEATDGSADGLLMNDASVLEIQSTRALCGETASVTATFGNYGRTGINSIDFEYEIAGTTGTFSLEAGDNAMPYGAVVPVSFDITMPDEAKRHDITLRIKSVNGKADEFTEGNECTGAAIALDPSSTKKRVAVIENYASLYQSDESYAIRSIEELQAEFGSQVLLIDAHYGQSGIPENWWNYDPWHCQDYASERERLFKIPYCKVNRTFAGDPYYGSDEDFMAGRNGMHDVIESITSQSAEAIIDGTAAISEDALSIDVVSNVTFLADVESTEDYTIGYVVTEDGLKGKQRNIYSGNYECFKWFRDLGLPDLPMWWERTFNDVAREASQRYGVPGSLYGPATAGTPVTFKFALPKPSAFENMRNCHVVMLLIEARSGEIMAAQKVAVSVPEGMDKIETVSSESTESICYSLTGQRLDASKAKGIVIINGKKTIKK